MKTANKKKATAPKRTTKTSSKPTSRKQETEGTVEESALMKLFEDELKDIYWAEKALTKALPKMAKKASSPELKQALESHLSETEQHVTKVEKIFDLLGKKAQAKKCEAMSGLIKEAEEIMQDTEEGAMRDAGIISAGQKVEHYEIASHGTLKTFAGILGLTEVQSVLESILEQEKNADAKLTDIAVSSINVMAADEAE